MPRKVDPKEAKLKAARFCAFRERSPKEVIEKLASWGLLDEDTEEILQELIEQNYVDEQRFANAYCHDKFEFNSWGKQKIRSSIYVHQLSKGVVEKALDRIDTGKYADRLHELAEKKWSALEGVESAKRKQKTIAFLQAKGFEIDLVWKALAKLEE